MNLVNVTWCYFEVSEPNNIVPTMTRKVPIHQVLFSTSLNKMQPKSAYKIKIIINMASNLQFCLSLLKKIKQHHDITYRCQEVGCGIDD